MYRATTGPNTDESLSISARWVREADHHYAEPAGAKIDFVLCDPSWRVLSATIIQDRPFGRWPSDHFPVITDLELLGHPPAGTISSCSRTEYREEADMTVKPIPDGYHSVTPYLIVQGADKLLDFLTRAFGAEETVRMPRPDGSIAHAEVRIGDSVVMLADAGEQWSPMPAGIHLYLEDCDATYLRALEAGATSVQEPADQFYGDRSAGVRDSLGNHWWIATHVEDLSEEEIAKRAEEQAAQQS
jgi:PhnB protein